LQVMLAIFIFF